MFLNWGFALSARNVLSLVRLGFLLLSFWRGMILKLLLLGVLVDRLVALDAVEVVGCILSFVSLGEICWHRAALRFAGRTYVLPGSAVFDDL